jgi:phosphoribosyl 1,2-cyclic phosphodiesterase
MGMEKITFLGSGGGRYVTINQTASTAGWILEMDDQMIHVDPGPGSLVRAKQYGVNLKKLTGVVVSHGHPDHYTDLEVVVESITHGTDVKRGFLLSTPTVINGNSKEPPKISNYHLNVIESYKSLSPGDTFTVGPLKITATPTKHGDGEGIGLVFEGKKKIGYTGDGEYFPGQMKHFKGCDCLILNAMRPREDPWPNHMNSGQAQTLIEKTKPGVAILSGFGMKMLFGKADREVQIITKETGVKTIAAKDGMVLDLSKETVQTQSLKKFLE